MMRNWTAYAVSPAIGLAAAASGVAVVNVPAFAADDDVQAMAIARDADCPPVDERGWPLVDFEFSGFSSREHAERATLAYLRCFAKQNAIKQWLEKQGFTGISVYYNRDIPPLNQSRATVSASRSMEKYDPVYGNAFSRWWQHLISHGTSIGIVLSSNGEVLRVSIGNIIL